MHYSRKQKWLSSFLIFSLLFLQTFEIPSLSQGRAEAKANTDLISLIVEDDIYSGAAETKIRQYAKDIQAYLPNTRVVIVPVESSSNPFTIASVNEKLYYEGDGEGLSRLVGTILVGAVPLPVVHKDGKAFLSVYPYVDFEMKSFLFDQAKNTYEYTTKSLTEENPEIWHSVIRPNTGDEKQNKAELVNFFTKTHDFYTKQGLFSLESTPKEPRVFYMDTLHDQASSSVENWKSYELYLEHVEDFAYNRYSKYLAKTLYDASQKMFSVDSSAIQDPELRKILDTTRNAASLDLSSTPDVATKNIIDKSVKQFFEAFNSKYLGDVLRYIHNTGRYGDGRNVRADMMPVVISKKDILMRQALKDVNTSLEGAIDQLVRTKISKSVPVLTEFRNSDRVFKNYFFGREASSVSNAFDCTIVRGSSLVAEANRGYVPTETSKDVTLLTADLSGSACFPGGKAATMSFWGGNSPLNLDSRSMTSGVMELGAHVYRGFSRPIYNLAGLKEIKGTALHTPTPLDCLNTDLLQQPYSWQDSSGFRTRTYYWPEEKGSAQVFSCITRHASAGASDYVTLTTSTPESCVVKTVNLDGQVTTIGNTCRNEFGSDRTTYQSYSFKSVPSIMEHKSPTDEEYGTALQSLTTPSLPSDRDRYVDFLDQNFKVKKIVYPNFFRMKLEGSELNKTGAEKRIKELLDAKTAEIKLLGGDLDLYRVISSDSKAWNILVEGVIWNNSNNATLKYSSTLERSLNIDGEKAISANGYENNYEMAYLGAPGDARSMYLKVDPEAKWAPPKAVSDVLAAANAFRWMVDGSNMTRPEEEPEFVCGPPEGVPLQEWMPAIFCWLKTILPPTIEGGSCGGSSVQSGGPSAFLSPENTLDKNKNGILDGYELIDQGELNLLSPGKVFAYQEMVPLVAELTKNGKLIDIDSFNKVSFELDELKVYSGSFRSGVLKTVYSRTENENTSDISKVLPYLSFKPMQVPAQNGVASYSFMTKTSDLEAKFTATIRTLDRAGNVVVDKVSNTIAVSVRSERISVQTQVTKSGKPESGSVIEAGNPDGIAFAMKKIDVAGFSDLKNSTPYTLRVYDDISGKLVREPVTVQTSEFVFKNDLLRTSWVYRFEFTDAKGIKGFARITVLPAPPAKIELIPSSSVFIAWEKTTIAVKVLDAFGNLARSEAYKLEGTISGGGVFAPEEKSSVSKNMIDGYTTFQIANKEAREMDVSFQVVRSSGTVTSVPLKLRSIDFAKISVEIEGRDTIVAGKNKHRVTIKLLDREGKLLDRKNESNGGFNGIVAMDFPALSGRLNMPFAKIVDGQSVDDIFLTPGYVAGKNLQMQMQIPGITTIVGDRVTVSPDVPMSFSFAKKDARLEAKKDNATRVRATMYDRYGNIANNTTGYTLALSIPEGLAKYASVSSNSVNFTEGALEFDLRSTALPGRAYVIGTVTPGLETNTFSVTDRSKKVVTVSGISKNVTSLDTYYLFNKEKLDRMRYAATYSVLLWGDYGDVTTEQYLWGEILFNHNSRSLAVTTLLGNPWQSGELFGFTPAGKYARMTGGNDLGSLQTSFLSDEKRSYIAFYDSYRKEYIAKAWLNFEVGNIHFIPCAGNEEGISNCSVSEKTSVFMKGYQGSIVSTPEWWGLMLKNAQGSSLARISAAGKIEKYPGVDLVLDEQVTANLLGVKIVSNGAVLGYLGIKFAADTIWTASSEGLAWKLETSKNALIVESLSGRYSFRKSHLGNSSEGAEGLVYSLNTPASNEIGALDPAYAERSGITGLESYPEATGIGFEDTNRSLLELAAGTTVGDATKHYQTFSTVTLGDAVAHLPKLQSTSNFDRTIGRQIMGGKNESIESYKKIDANGDGVSDLVVFYESGKMQLLMNYAGSLKDMGYLAYVADAGRGRKWVGDFFGDSYSDIVLTNAKGDLVLLDNTEGKFVQKKPIIVNASGALEPLLGKIQQLEIFDMDNDKKADLVVVDDSGEISILYGETRPNNELGLEHIFTKKAIEKGFGIELSKSVRNDGGAFSYRGLTLPKSTILSETSSQNRDMIDNIIYYQTNYSSEEKAANTQADTLSALEASMGNIEGGTSSRDLLSLMTETQWLSGTNGADFSAISTPVKKTFVRSPFAEGKWLLVEKKYTQSSSTILRGGDRIGVEITLTNTTNTAFQDAVYLDSNDANIFRPEEGGKYVVTRSGTGKELPLRYLTEDAFDYGFDLATIGPRETIVLRYTMEARPVSFGAIQVGLLERGEAGDDTYGDIALSPSNMCGGRLIMWRSVSPAPRSYQKGEKVLTDSSTLPEALRENGVDLDKNGTPDSIDALIRSAQSGNTSTLQSYSEGQLSKYNIDANGNRIPDRGEGKGSSLVSYDARNGQVEVGGLSSGNIDAVNSQIDEAVRGLGCGFGGGGCINSPLNWAPLAPGSAPTAFGYPLTPLTPYTGIPVFSAPTTCTPVVVWPPCPAMAGGYFGATLPVSFRLFITPTITGAMGVAACYGSNAASLVTWAPGASPIVPGGNCVVAAMPLASCKDDGSDGDAGSIGLGISTDQSYVNANACVSKPESTPLLSRDRDNVLRYMGGDTAVLPEINASMARGGLSSVSAGPIIGIGNTGGDANFEIALDSAGLRNLDMGNIVKIKNKRVSAFPDFLMDWVTRQLEEVVNKLTSLPTLYIILPDFSGFEEISTAFSPIQNKDYASQMKSTAPIENTTLQWMQGSLNGLVDNNADTINAAGKNISGIKAAYEFMSHLPLLKLETEMVDVSIPMLSIEEMDKWLIDAKGTQKQWELEWKDKKDKWSKLQNLSEADKKIMVDTDALLGTLQENIATIEEYKRFPEKLQKYLTWKERYASQLLCNIEAIEQMVGGWIGENGRRFKAWVELYILIKSILSSWQGIIDLFDVYEAECATCANERYDLKHFIFKLISGIIPKIPIIQFPKWPDVWLDLHNIRAGIRILMPEFHFNFVPIVLPSLPRLALPDVPTVTFHLPGLPLLARLPELPELPDLPSLPTIKLPSLPPPPTIPKLFGSIAAIIDIFKLVAKVLCIMKINPFVPEWRAGDQIAQLTERQGRLPIDFLNVEFPNVSVSFVDKIEVTTYVNLELETDFILEMARAVTDPINSFTNDVSNIGAFSLPDVDLRVLPDRIDIPVWPQGYEPAKPSIMTALLAKLSLSVAREFVALNAYVEKHADETVTTEVFKDILRDNIEIIRNMNDPKALAIADNLELATNYRGESEDRFIEELEKKHTEKYGLLKDYVRQEEAEARRLKTELNEMLRTGEAPDAVISSEYVKISTLSTDSDASGLKKSILATNDQILPSLDSIRSGKTDSEVQDIRDMGSSLMENVDSGLQSFARDMRQGNEVHGSEYARSNEYLLAAVNSEIPDNATATGNTPITANPVVATAAPTAWAEKSATASSYQYEGIYILDKNGKQVRLFDYLDGVDGKEELVYADMDGDGDDDIVYRMDNSLYLKENFDKSPSYEYISDTPKILDPDSFLHRTREGADILAAPNHFEETFVASNEIDFSFRPAHSLSDNLFRMEYLDYIDRFDRLTAREKEDALARASRHYVDMVPDISNDKEVVSDTEKISLIGRKNIVSFGDGVGSAFVTMSTGQIMTESSPAVIVSKGRTIYTDGEGARIHYLRDGEKVPTPLDIAKNTNYEFLSSAKITVKNGNVYLWSEVQESKNIPDITVLKGIPLLPGTKVEMLSPKGRLSLRYYDGGTEVWNGLIGYEYYALGQKSDEYSVSLEAQNGWHYSRIHSFSRGAKSTTASLDLLSPQKESDKEGPLITFEDTIRLPVYQSQILALRPYLEDISGVERVYIDADLTKDTDGDGNLANDRDSLDPASAYRLIGTGSSIYTIGMGPFDTLFTKKIRLFAEDGNNNTSFKDITLTVYPPVPAIESVSGGTISGRLDEVLAGEPIDIFRLRNGNILRIPFAEISGSKTNENGAFSLRATTSRDLSLTKSGSAIASIDERTGKISLSDTSFALSVLPATKDRPMSIQVLDSGKNPVYSEHMSLPNGARIEEVSEFTGTGIGLFVLPTTGFSFVKNTLSSPSLSDGGFIVKGATPIAWVSKTGNIYILDNGYSLRYSIKDAYIVIQIVRDNEVPVAQLLYRINAEYILK